MPSPLAVRHIHSTCRHSKCHSHPACLAVPNPAFYPPLTQRCGAWQPVACRALRNYYYRCSRLAQSRNSRRHWGSRYDRYYFHSLMPSFPISGFGYNLNSLPAPGADPRSADKSENELAHTFATIFSTQHQSHILTILAVWFPFLRIFVRHPFSTEIDLRVLINEL